MMTAIEKINLSAQEWLREKCWRLWATSGIDPRGGFRERLLLDGQPIEDPSTRTRVQARQLYVFCEAARAGWPGAEKCIDFGISSLEQARRPDGLYALRIALGQGIAIDGVDLYDQAFVLFALSKAYAITAEKRIRARAFELLEAIEQHLKRPGEVSGYFEDSHAGSIRHQNHHMHLFEAFLSGYEIFEDEVFMIRARSVSRFVARAFVDKRSGAIHELSHLAKREWPENDRIEAGHQFEWFWLLQQAANLGMESPDVSPAPLLETGRRLMRTDGRISLSHFPNGQVRQSVLRSWVQTEALKAFLADFENGNRRAADEAVRCVEILFEDHLLENGGWMDIRDHDLNPVSEFMPASSGYHAVLALTELNRISSIPA